MKVICIDAIDDDLTIGKVYDVITGTYYIADDSGDIHWYSKEAFISLDEYRAKQIESLL